MLDIRYIREQSQEVRDMLLKRNAEAPLDEILELDKKWRKVKQDADELRAKRNRISIEIAELKKRKQDAGRGMAEMKGCGEELDMLEGRVKELEGQVAALALSVPNVPHSSVPVGKDEGDNVLVRSWGKPKKRGGKAHWELGKERDVIDFERGVKLAGSRFSVLRGAAAKLERALINYMLDTHSNKGYLEMSPPLLANERTMTGTGQLPKFEIELYRCERDNLYLIPTAEVPLTNMHSGEILDAGELPIHYVAYTPCFRREAGSYGKDIKGIMRQHQFDKVELVKITEPESSYEELEKLVADSESILQGLGLPYQVKELCTGDLGFSSSKTYDLEVWVPSQNKYREIASCSNCGAFQARRANIRYRKKGKLGFVHTLNGSGVAVGRTLLALMENCQTEDGSIEVPDALRQYLGGKNEV